MEPLSLLARRAVANLSYMPRSNALRALPKHAASIRAYSSLRLSPYNALLQNMRTRLSLDWRRLREPSRYSSSLSVPGAATSEPPQDLTPAYQLTFTCKPCGSRSSHRVTKQGYHHGTVLIQCPTCKNRHVIADHLNVFLDQKSSLEDILSKKLEDGKPLASLLKKGKLGIRQDSLVGNEGEEDFEFWEDGTETLHQRDTPEVETPQKEKF